MKVKRDEENQEITTFKGPGIEIGPSNYHITTKEYNCKCVIQKTTVLPSCWLSIIVLCNHTVPLLTAAASRTLSTAVCS